MAGAHITVHDVELRQGLADMLRQLERPADALREIGEVLTNSTKRRFGTQTDPTGRRWEPNSEVTLERKTNPNILTEGGFLGDGIRHQLTADGRGVQIVSDRIYAAVQQFGQPQGASGTNRRGAPIPWGDIRARPFLGLSDEDEDQIMAILRDYLAEQG